MNMPGSAVEAQTISSVTYFLGKTLTSLSKQSFICRHGRMTQTGLKCFQRGTLAPQSGAIYHHMIKALHQSDSLKMMSYGINV